MTRDEAITTLHECPQCKRWITTSGCDHCWVDSHKCPPDVAEAMAALLRAIEIGKEAQALMSKIR